MNFHKRVRVLLGRQSTFASGPDGLMGASWEPICYPKGKEEGNNKNVDS